MAEASDKGAESKPFESRLGSGKERFLACCIEHAFLTKRRSPEDFIRHFPPSEIMRGLSTQPKLRATILVMTTGLKPSIAEKKSWESAAEDLQIALEEGETDAQAVVDLFDPDDRIRYLDPTKVWGFLTEGDFWNASIVDREAHGVAKNNVAFVVSQALTDRLVTHREVVEGITVGELASRLPKAELGRIIEAALQKGKSSAAFTESDLLGAMPPKVIVEHVPLAKIWSSVVEPLSKRHGYVAEAPAPAPAPAPVPAPAAEAAAAAPAPAAEKPEAEPATPVPAKVSEAPPNSTDAWITIPESEAPPEGEDDVVSDDDFAST
ncbi:MAG: hypothetical protein U0263_05340 [Polyangiaceae bacterium]